MGKRGWWEEVERKRGGDHWRIVVGRWGGEGGLERNGRSGEGGGRGRGQGGGSRFPYLQLFLRSHCQPKRKASIRKHIDTDLHNYIHTRKRKRKKERKKERKEKKRKEKKRKEKKRKEKKRKEKKKEKKKKRIKERKKKKKRIKERKKTIPKEGYSEEVEVAQDPPKEALEQEEKEKEYNPSSLLPPPKKTMTNSLPSSFENQKAKMNIQEFLSVKLLFFLLVDGAPLFLPFWGLSFFLERGNDWQQLLGGDGGEGDEKGKGEGGHRQFLRLRFLLLQLRLLRLHP